MEPNNNHITIYEKPSCTTCRKVYAILKASGVDFDAVNYFVDRIPPAKLKNLIQKMGISGKDLLRTTERRYQELGLDSRTLSDDEAIAIMAEHPELIQRPIVEKGDRAILARPAERIKDFLQ